MEQQKKDRMKKNYEKKKERNEKKERSLRNRFTVITCKRQHFKDCYDESFSYKSVKVKVD